MRKGQINWVLFFSWFWPLKLSWLWGVLSLYATSNLEKQQTKIFYSIILRPILKETIVQEILRKYFSTPWVARYQDLRKNISNISQRIKSGLQNFTAQENDCNRILFGRNNAVSFDEFNTQGLFLMREAIFQYLRSSDPKLQYCLKDEVSV